jgi:hypothetical protein
MKRRPSGKPGLGQARMGGTLSLARRRSLGRPVLRARVDSANAASRTKARSEAAAAELAARGTADGAGRREEAARRLGVTQAIAWLARKHGIAVTVGWTAGDPRYAGGVPLVDTGGTLVAVLNPDPELVHGEAFLLLAGTLLLFPSGRRQMTLDGYGTGPACAGRRVPGDFFDADGYFADSGWCACAVPQLVVSVNCRKYHAEPEVRNVLVVGHAECEACGRLYFGPWRLTATKPAPASG